MNYTFKKGSHMMDLMKMTNESIIKNLPENAKTIGHRKPYAGTGVDGYLGPKLSARSN